MTDAFSQIWDEASQSYIGSDGAERVHTGQLRDEQSPPPHPPTEAIERLKEAAERATPGEWKTGRHYLAGNISIESVADRGWIAQPLGGRGDEQHARDMAFIAQANPSFILSLISSYEERGRLLSAARDRCIELHNALTPSADTKAAYIGEVKFSVSTGFDEDGCEVWQNITVPWTATKDIMAMILGYAATSSLSTPKGKGEA